MPTKFKLFTKSIVVLGLTAVLVALVFGFKFVVNKKAFEVGELSQTLALASHKRDNLSQLQSKLASLDLETDKIKNFTLEKDNLVLFIENLEKISRETKVEAVVDSVQEDEEVVFVVKASGSFANLYLLISQIEMMPHPVFIEDLKINALVDVDGSTKKVWQSEITIRLLTVEGNEKKVDKPKQDE